MEKNFIYDFMNVVPSMLSQEKFEELSIVDDTKILKQNYKLQENGFFKCVAQLEKQKNDLKYFFKKTGFSALNFTDSRGKFQFYPLSRIWNDIQIGLDSEINILNLATEPIEISELYRYLTGEEFVNYITQNIPLYDFRTIYANKFGGLSGYICRKEEILKDIKMFVQGQKK